MLFLLAVCSNFCVLQVDPFPLSGNLSDCDSIASGLDPKYHLVGLMKAHDVFQALLNDVLPGVLNMSVCECLDDPLTMEC